MQNVSTFTIVILETCYPRGAFTSAIRCALASHGWIGSQPALAQRLHRLLSEGLLKVVGRPNPDLASKRRCNYYLITPEGVKLLAHVRQAFAPSGGERPAEG